MSLLPYFDALEDAIDRAELDAEEADAACFRARASQPAILRRSTHPHESSQNVAPNTSAVSFHSVASGTLGCVDNTRLLSEATFLV